MFRRVIRRQIVHPRLFRRLYVNKVAKLNLFPYQRARVLGRNLTRLLKEVGVGLVPCLLRGHHLWPNSTDN